MRLRAMLGMVRAQRWSYLQRPRPWCKFHHCSGAGGGAGGAVSSNAGRASMARNGQAPRRSASATGVVSEVIWRYPAWRHPQWRQVGSRGILLQRPSSALRTRATTGVIVVLEGGGSSEGSGFSRSTSAQQQHQDSKNNSGSSGSGSDGAALQRTVQVDAISTTASAPVAAPAVPSAVAPGAMPAATPGVSTTSDAWKIYP